MQIVCVGEAQEKEDTVAVAEEHYEIDQLREYKNWSMQSPGWKMFTALFDFITEEQFQYKCKNDKTILENLASILKLALIKDKTDFTDDPNKQVKAITQVKSFIISHIIPKFVNKSLKFLEPKHTLIYLDLFNQAMKIEGHLRDYT